MDICTTTLGDCVRFALKGIMSFRDKDRFTPVLDAATAGGLVTVDLSELEHVDSFGIGLLLLANEQASASGCRLRLVNPQGAVARVFELANLDAVLNLRADTSPRAAVAAPRRKGISYRYLPATADGAPCVGLSGRLVFAEHALFEEIVEALLSKGGARVVLDLADLDFMDSAGLSMVMIAREEAEAKGRRLALRNPKGAVERLLTLSALEFMLEE